DIIEEAFEKTVDEGKTSPLIGSRLHDFGFRGCTCVEQSVLGGVAHLLNFDGTDTMSAAFYAQFKLNGGTPVGQSIPATEHSVMTSWRTEQAAIENMIEHFGEGLFACVMDSYDYSAALREVLPVIREKKLGKGGFMVLRPDSGDPVEAVLEGLRVLAPPCAIVEYYRAVLALSCRAFIVRRALESLHRAACPGEPSPCGGPWRAFTVRRALESLHRAACPGEPSPCGVP
ncbi:hypothetical protein CYMTET_6723, partial [Cymbomonas tetramitiformis]